MARSIFFTVIILTLYRFVMSSFIETIRHAVFKRFVNKKLNRNVQHRPVSISIAAKVGILFQADEDDQRHAVEHYAERLKQEGKDVQLLGFLKRRNHSIDYLFPYISNKDVTWYGKPKGGTIGYFIKYPFDILINFAPKELVPFEYISALSHAGFRIGFNEKNLLEPYDCILLAESKNDTNGLIKNIDKYLS